MEGELDKIAEGELTYKKVLDDFYKPFNKDLEKLEEKAKSIKASLIEKTDIDCDKCGKKMIIKWGRNGRFLSCSGYPNARMHSLCRVSRKSMMKLQKVRCAAFAVHKWLLNQASMVNFSDAPGIRNAKIYNQSLSASNVQNAAKAKLQNAGQLNPEDNFTGAAGILIAILYRIISQESLSVKYVTRITCLKSSQRKKVFTLNAPTANIKSRLKNPRLKWRKRSKHFD
jgi:ssDNA-binding Zn-finger/Zn-ribbon topoisomerase 1